MERSLFSLCLRAVCLFVAVAAASGCASFSAMQTAHTVAEGEVRYAVSLQGVGGGGAPLSSFEPGVEGSVRYGIAEDWDVGLKLHLLGAQAGAKVQLMRGDFDLALALEGGYGWVWSAGIDAPRSHVLVVRLPLLMEQHLHEIVGLTFGPELSGVWAVAGAERGDVYGDTALYGGGRLGVVLRLLSNLWLMPEVMGQVSLVGGDSFGSNIIWQGGMTFFFGAL